MFWIKAILRRKYLTTERHDANHAALELTNNDLTSAMETVASVCHENQLLAQRQLALSACINHINEAPVCTAPPVQATIPDEISALTDMLGRFAALSTATMITSPSTTSTARHCVLGSAIATATAIAILPPAGADCFMAAIAGSVAAITHWTRKCDPLTQAKKTKYRDANFGNRMDGSTKFLDWRGPCQNEFS
eukprot:CAMPEP_0168230050 /NCGR_PEP_ID=MMETSP0140_2-20121125/15675_1 /TAXON_ID=44445 /ORGANISM="Pseudo-nitzschia australis, Strain 10249 10 AB" /LENGTH=192 /DNA_ID=CAMNT_0008162049 /DNA_START=344 /DNA_END=920 /DNA_ORIENTATION=+